MTPGNPDAGFAQQADQLVESLRRGRLDEADTMYQRLCEQDPKARDMLAIPVLIAIQRGRLLDALRLVDQHPADHSPELRALCLRVLGDPSWHGEATALLESPDPVIARAMRQLLSVHDEAEDTAFAGSGEWPNVAASGTRPDQAAAEAQVSKR